jgi:hypothetical protein
MFANRDYRNDASAPVKLETGGKPIEWLDKKTGEWSDAQLVDGKVQLKIAAGDGELYRW